MYKTKNYQGQKQNCLKLLKILYLKHVIFNSLNSNINDIFPFNTQTTYFGLFPTKNKFQLNYEN